MSDPRYRQPRKPTQYQAQFTSDWAKVWGGLGKIIGVLAFLAWPGWIWKIATGRIEAGFWIVDGIWWGFLVFMVLVIYVLPRWQNRWRPH